MTNLRNRTGKWYETTAIVDRMQDDGTAKKMKEVYVVDALSCTEAETRVIDELSNATQGELSVVKVQLLPAQEFVFDESNQSNIWYKAKLVFVTIDEVSAKEKRTSQYMYVQAKDLAEARTDIVEVFKDTMYDYSLVALSETNVLDVFEYIQEG